MHKSNVLMQKSDVIGGPDADDAPVCRLASGDTVTDEAIPSPPQSSLSDPVGV